MEEILKNRANLEGFSEQDLKATWEIFQSTTRETETEVKDFFGKQAEKFFDRLRDTKVHTFCCEKHGEVDSSIASLIADFLGYNGGEGAAFQILSLLDPRASALRALAAFTLGVQFGIVMERSKTAQYKEISELEKLFGKE